MSLVNCSYKGRIWCPTPPAIREMQIKTPVRYHLTLAKRLSSKSLQIINAGEDVETWEPMYTVGGNVKLVQSLWRTVCRFLKKL